MKLHRRLALLAAAAAVQGVCAAAADAALTTGDFTRMDRLWPGSAEGANVLGAAAASASASDIPYDFTVCTHGRPQMLESTGDFTGYAYEGWGVVASSASKEWERASTHCLGYVRWMGSTQVGKGLCKWIQASGDSAVGEFEFTPTGERRWTWLTGTGTLKGIAGGGTFQDIFTAGTVDAGTAQGCRRDWGRYTLAR